MLRSDLVAWLLKAETPSIRYLTARDLLGLADDHPQVTLARHAIMSDGIVPAIFSKQNPAGHWGKKSNFYAPKYVSTHWNLLLLSELCVDPTDERFQRGVEYMLDATAKPMHSVMTAEGHGWSCFWGNLLYYAVYAGRVDDPRVQAIVDYVMNDMNDGRCRCRGNDEYSCAWGVVRSLWGLAAVARAEERIDIQVTLYHALQFLLDSFRLVEANYPTRDNGKINPLWFKPNFPLFYQADILFTLRVLADLEMLDHPNAVAALHWLEAQRSPNGRWRGSSPFRQRTWLELGYAVETSRWVTLQASVILQKAQHQVGAQVA